MSEACNAYLDSLSKMREHNYTGATVDRLVELAKAIRAAEEHGLIVDADSVREAVGRILE